jgi:hypothetical protein
MSQYKTRKLRDLEAPSVAVTGLRANSQMRWSPMRAALEAQDRVLATSRRIVAEYGLNGSDTWHVPDDTAGDPGDDALPVATQIYPDSSWRTVNSQIFTLTPGCMLEARVLFVGAGTVQKQLAISSPNWVSDGAWGIVRVGATFTSADGLSSSGPHYFELSMPGSGYGTYGGGENPAGGGDWLTLEQDLIKDIRPPTFHSDPSVGALYSEGCVVELTIELSGSPRIVHMPVYERPLLHTHEHDTTDPQSAHALQPGLAPTVSRPVEKPPDDGLEEEHRGGTTRMMEVAARQAERLGPIVLGLTCWDEDEQEWDQSEGTPFTITATSFVDIYDSTNTTYDDQNPGFIVAGSHAQLHRLCEDNLISRGEFAVIPVRVRIDAAMTGGTGTVRIQSSPYEWVDVTIGSGARSVTTAVGHLYSQVHADHAAANVQVFARVTAGTLTIYYASVEFGH